MFEIMSEKCDQCLMSANKVVSNARRREILAKTRRDDCAFECHKGSIAGRHVACRGHFNATGGGQLARIAGRLRAIVEIDPKTMQVAAPAT